MKHCLRTCKIDSISKKVRKNIGIIKHVRDSVPKESLTLLYKTLVEPYFRCCSSAWGKRGTSLIDKLQTLQNRAARAVSKVKFDETDHEQLLKSLGWLNIHQLTDFDTASLLFEISRQKMPKQRQELFTKCETFSSWHNLSKLGSPHQMYVPSHESPPPLALCPPSLAAPPHV